MISHCQVGKPAPEFSLSCVRADEEAPRSVSLSDYRGRWLVLMFYPRDFSFVCPTELTAFSAHVADFAGRECDLLAASVDSVELHREWLMTPPAEGGLGPLRFPLASDPQGEAARAYGVWVEQKEVATRGLFVVDPDGVLQYLVKHNLSVGRRPEEVLRVLDALRTGGLCPANWTSADGTIDPEQCLQPGRILGRYRIRKLIGSGSFGSVFAVWDLRLQRMVALKVLHRDVFESRDVALAEGRAAAALSHPNICTIYAVDEEDGLPVIAMEYLDGVPLSQLIQQGLDRKDALALARQIGLGMAVAHSQDVVHGDLKPANVIVTTQGIAKIVDFGLAAATTASRRTEPGDRNQRGPGVDSASVESEAFAATIEGVAGPSGDGIQGTPAYMSPEQAQGRRLTPASDVFSFGLMWYEMLTGRPAHAGRSVLETLGVLETQDLGPELAADVDEPFRPLLLAMLARDPRRRPSMNEVLQTAPLSEPLTAAHSARKGHPAAH